jgi:hypothetical protein
VAYRNRASEEARLMASSLIVLVIVLVIDEVFWAGIASTDLMPKRLASF